MSTLDNLRTTMRPDRVWDFLVPEREVMVQGQDGPILYVEDVTVSFDGFKALNALNLYINKGELRCIIGANGAGKSTMMDVVTGKLRPDEGSVYFGQNINLLKLSEPQIASCGVGRKFQKPTVFENHTVFHNLELAMRTDKRVLPTLFARLSSEQGDHIQAVLETIGLRELQNSSAGALSHGQKQWLEIGVLLIQDPQLLLVDEPVAGMTPQETERTAELLTSLAGERSVVVVEHDMEFVRSIAKTVTVLHQGSVLAEGTMSQIQNNQQVREVYLGE